MSEGAKYTVIRKILKALGLSEESIDDIIQWIEDLLLGKGKKDLTDFPYKVRDDFLSPAERSFYLTLRGCVSDWADVCPKVSLGDLFYAVSNSFGERQSYTNRINRKHIDFLICDKKTARPLIGIELDDRSHDNPKRQERDYFVENVFNAAKLPLERINVRSAYNPNELNTRLQEIAGIPKELPGQSVSLEGAANPLNTPQDNTGNPLCPRCSSVMTLRTAKSGTNIGQKFWGCSNFPKCRAIVPYAG